MKVKIIVFAVLLGGALFGLSSCTQDDEPRRTTLPIDDIWICEEDLPE